MNKCIPEHRTLMNAIVQCLPDKLACLVKRWFYSQSRIKKSQSSSNNLSQNFFFEASFVYTSPVSDVDQVSILFQKMGYPSRFFFYFSSTFLPLFPSIFPIFSRGDYTHIFFRYDNTLLAYTYYNVRGW